MPVEAFHSEFAQGRVFWLVVRLPEGTCPILAVSSTMLDCVQSSVDNANIIVDLHTPGIDATIAAGKVVKVIVKNLSFTQDYTQESS
jgi:hypothetical protein